MWTSRAPDLDHPDVCVFDLDPSRDDPEAVRAAALALRELLNELGLPSWVKTSGSEGFHIVVPLDGKSTTDDVARFAHVDPATTDAGTIVQGVDMVEKKLLKALGNAGLEVINPVGETFDPALHEAVATEPTSAREDGHPLAPISNHKRPWQGRQTAARTFHLLFGT